MRHTFRFAPVSGAASWRIGIAAWYFMAGGVVIALLTLLPPVFNPDVLDAYTPTQVAINLILSLAWAGTMFWTGVLIGRGLRLGAYFALGFTMLSLTSAPSVMSLAIAVLSLVVLAPIWKDLR